MESSAAEHRWPQLDSVGGAAYPLDILAKSSPWSASKSEGSQNWSSISNCTWIPPLPFYGSPAVYLGLLLVALVAFIIWWLWRNLLQLPTLELGADQVPVIRERQLPGRIRSILDADKVVVAEASIRGSIHSTLGRRPLQVSDSHGYFRYPAIHSLEAVPNVRLLDPNSMEETIRALPDATAAAVQMLREASIHYDPIGRLSDVCGNASNLCSHTDPSVLATRSTETVIELKITMVLVSLIWQELNRQTWQLCQEVKKECFTLVAGQSVEKLLEVARSFSDASWYSCHVPQVLTIFDALVEVLYNIQGLPLNRSDEVAGISSKMVDAFSRILRTTDVIVSSEGATIHPANDILIQGLKFFHDNRDMVQSTVSAGNTCSDLFNSWESKLEKDAKRISQDEKGEKYIFLLNNTYDVWQKMCLPGASFSDIELVSRLISMIQRYRKSYFDECWVRLMSLLEGDYLKNPCRSSLDKFTQRFVSICRCQMTWKVCPVLKYELREEIKNVMVRPYEVFLGALQANSSRRSQVVYWLKQVMRRKKNKNVYTVEQLKKTLEELYES